MGFTPAKWLICCSWEDLVDMKLNGAGNGLSQYNIAVIRYVEDLFFNTCAYGTGRGRAHSGPDR